MSGYATIEELPNTEPVTEAEVLFIRGLPYYAPRISKQIAFCLDNGSTKESLLSGYKGDGPMPQTAMLQMFHNFVDFYLSEPERAKELFMPYSWTDYGHSTW